MFQAFFLLLILSTFSVRLSLLDAIQSFTTGATPFLVILRKK